MSNPAQAKRSIAVETEIKTTPEAVWKALTDAGELVKWFAPEARVTPGEGGEIYLSWGEGMGGGARITIWDPPRHLQTVETWQSDAAANPRVQDWYIEAGEGGAVKLRLVHSGFGAESQFDAEYDATTGGWKTFFVVLHFLLERHAADECVNVTEFRPTSLGWAEAWERLTGPGGLNTGTLSVGAPYAFTTAEGERLSGEVRRYDARKGYLAVTVEEWNGALLCLFCEGTSQGVMVTVQVYLYGEATRQAEAQRAKWRGFMERRIPASGG